MPGTTSPRRRSSPPTQKPVASPPRLPPLTTLDQHPAHPTPLAQSIPPSPVAPAFSPITPRALPALPAISIPPHPPPQNGTDAPPAAAANPTTGQQPPQSHPESQPAIAPTEYIPAPPPRPFSSEDSTDAIALRAAISSLQLQKKKAQDDIRTLERVRKQAIEDPGRFKEELAAGRVRERKMTAGDLRAILDAESDDDDDEEEEWERDRMDTTAGAESDTLKSAEVPDSQPLPTRRPRSDEKPPFDAIPGAQSVVRMPHINWDKYHIAGEPLERMHEQQRKWPGNFAHGTERGREFTVAAPYSPWLDSLDGGVQERKDSAGGSFSSQGGAGTTSEHPMETRRGGVRR